MSSRWNVDEKLMEVMGSGERWIEEQVPGSGGLFKQVFAADDRAVLDEAERRTREYARRIEDMRLYSPVPLPTPLPGYPGCQPPRFTPRRKSYKTKRSKR